VTYLTRFGRFWWEFVVGDNLPLAIGAGATIGLTAVLVHAGLDAWWLLPIATLGLLAAAVLHAAADRGRARSAAGGDGAAQSASASSDRSAISAEGLRPGASSAATMPRAENAAATQSAVPKRSRNALADE
jgi:hypothetical protein